MDIKNAINNIKEDTEAYIKAFFALYLDLDSLEQLDQLYQVFINSNYEIFSDDIKNYVDEYIESEKLKNISYWIELLSSQINRKVNTEALKEDLENSKVINRLNIDTINNRLRFKIEFSKDDEQYILGFKDNILVGIYKYDYLYNNKVNEYLDNNKEIHYIVTLKEDAQIVGLLIDPDLDLNEFLYGVKDPSNSPNFILSDDNKKLNKEIFLKLVNEVIKEIKKIKLSKDFSYKKFQKDILDKSSSNIAVEIFKSIFNKISPGEFFEDLDIPNIIYKDKIEVAKENINDFFIELEKYNIKKLSYKEVKENAKIKIESQLIN